MSTNVSLLSANQDCGRSWRCDVAFSTNRLEKTLSQSEMLAELEEMFDSRLSHARPKQVTACLIVISQYMLDLICDGHQTCIYGYVQCNVPTKLTTLQKWIPDCDEWHRMHGGLYDNTDFRNHIADPDFFKIKVYGEINWQNNTGRKAVKVHAFPTLPPPPPAPRISLGIKFLYHK